MCRCFISSVTEEHYDACTPIVDSFWSFTMDDETPFFLDIGADGFIDPGDSFIFESAPLAVSIDTTLLDVGFFSGTCTATPELTPEREYCSFSFDFGDLGTVAVQGPLEAMVIVGTTGCFAYYSGEVVGYIDGDSYVFYVDTWARR